MKKRYIFLTLLITAIILSAYVYPGQVINIPKKPNIPEKFVLHAVIPRDTLWDISKEHMPKLDPRDGVKAIREVNGLNNSYIIQPGDVLTIPSDKGNMRESGPDYSTEELSQEAAGEFEKILPATQDQRLRDTELHSGRGIKYQEIVMMATAYTSGPESTGKHPGHPAYGVTYSGLPAAPGAVAVDPEVIPLGTSLYIEGYGYAKAVDTGRVIQGNLIDVYFEEVEKALKWGRKQVKVRVFK